MLFLRWFYKVVRDKCCFYIGFTRVVREKPDKTCVKSLVFVDNPPGMVSPQQKDGNCPHNSPSYTIESLISRSLARTHERNETISRLAVSQKDSPPQPPIYIYIYTHTYRYIHIIYVIYCNIIYIEIIYMYIYICYFLVCLWVVVVIVAVVVVIVVACVSISIVSGCTHRAFHAR